MMLNKSKNEMNGVPFKLTYSKKIKHALMFQTMSL